MGAFLLSGILKNVVLSIKVHCENYLTIDFTVSHDASRIIYLLLDKSLLIYRNMEKYFLVSGLRMSGVIINTGLCPT